MEIYLRGNCKNISWGHFREMHRISWKCGHMLLRISWKCGHTLLRIPGKCAHMLKCAHMKMMVCNWFLILHSAFTSPRCP